MTGKSTTQAILEMDARITELARVVGNALQEKSVFREVDTPPASFNSAGEKGDICFHGDYVYYCYQNNKWQKWITIKEF